MSNHATKPCPRCNEPSALAIDSGGLDGHTGHIIGHEAIKNAMHGHPVSAVLLLAGAGIKAVMPKKYRCRPCDHSFTA